MRSQKFAMTTATRLAACSLLIAAVLAISLLVTSRAYAQQGCTQVKMIFGDADNTLYLIDGNGDRLRDIQSRNTLSNRQVNSFIVLRGTPFRIGIEIAGTGQTLYRYKNNVRQSGDMGFEDYIDNDYNDAVILLTPINCPGTVVPPSPPPSPPPPVQNPPPANQVNLAPSMASVSVDNITKTAARAVVNIDNHNGTELSVELRYQVKADEQDWTTDVETAEATGTGSPVTQGLADLTPGTEYVLQASFDATFPDDATEEYTFTTDRQPNISSVSVDNITKTTARAVVNIDDHDGSTQTAKLQYRTTSPQGQWSTPPLEESSTGATAQIDLSGLSADIAYEVQAWLAADSTNKKTDTFRTLQTQQQSSPVSQKPSISDLEFENIDQTSATAVVTIADAGTSQKTVYHRYRVQGTDEWTTILFPTITHGDSASIALSGLQEQTVYEVAVALADDFSSMVTKSFTTLLPPSLSGVSIGSVTQTTAVATVSIADAGSGQKTVLLQYRVFGESIWNVAKSKTTDGAGVSFDLAGLSPKTKYEVEASLKSDFSGSKSATFTTLALEPVMSGVKVNDIVQTSARAVVEIANANGEQQTVRLRYRTTSPQGDWSDTQETTSSIATASIVLFAFTAGTEYEVEASLDADFGRAESATFTTLRYPSISDLEVRDETKNSATAVITIADSDGSGQTVHLRYRTTTPQGSWSDAQKITTSTSTAGIVLTGLATDTEYEAEASLTSDFTVVVSDTFTTLPPDPVVSDVNVSGITQTTATANIDIANSHGSSLPVNLRYRTTTARGDWSSTLTTTSSTDGASIDLAGLTPGTEYDVQASLDGTFPAARTKYDSFTTLRYPSIASLEAENIGRNGATVVATIADSQGEAQTVYVRHRQARHIAWRTTQHTDSVDDVASLRLRGLSSGTEYVAEASLDSTFPEGETRSVTFTTKERRDDDDDAGGGGVVAQPAHARDAPLPGHSPLTLRFITVEGGDNPAPQTFSVWNRVYGTMDFVLSNHEEWLMQEPVSGVSSGPGDPVTITASVDSSELAAGQYVDVINIKVSSSGSSAGQVIVVLDVLPPDYIRQFVSRVDGGVVMLPGGAVKIVVPPLAPPKDVDIELMKLNLMAHGIPPGERERVVVAVDSNTYPPGGDTPEDVAYSPNVELWVMLPAGESDSCVEGRIRVYSVQPGDWSHVEHRCEADEAGNVWAVSDIERLGAFALVIDDSPAIPTPTPAASALAPPVTPAVANASSATVRTSLPAQPPTPVPSVVPTPMPVPVRQPAVVPEIMPTPTPTAVPQSEEPPVPALQATVETRDSGGGFNGLTLGALGLPLLIGGGVVAFLFYRESRRNGKQ